MKKVIQVPAKYRERGAPRQTPELKEKDKPYLIFRGPRPVDEYLIGNLPLETATAIHADNIIAVDHEAYHIFVKEESFDDIVNNYG